MNLTAQVAAAQAEVDAAGRVLAQAQANLEQAQALLDKAQPHLSILSDIEAFTGQLDISVREAFAALIAKAKALF